MTNKICDLHTHSNCSDGSLSPTELVAAAKKQNIAVLALTDHNTTKGLKEFMAAGKTYDLITVPGCEFSTDYGDTELHIVGLFLPERSWPAVEDYVEILKRNKHRSNLLLIEKLRERGCEISYDEVAALTDADEFNRAHVARVLLAKRFVSSMDQAFNTLLKPGNGCYFPSKRPDVLETTSFIRKIGGLAVLAHPFLNLDHAELETFLPQAKAAGMTAMETYYSLFDKIETDEASALAERFGLLQSGGSDFHDAAKPAISLGTGQGDLCVPFSVYETLLQYREKAHLE